MPFPTALPLPAFVLRPITAAVIAAVHVYLAAGHLSRLFGGEVEWTHMWKGCGALAGAYLFTALAFVYLCTCSAINASRPRRFHSAES